jgi:acetoin utilization deacetylase AcuC-like enzyme
LGKTGIVYDDIYLEHETWMHPENKERLRRTVAYLKSVGLWDRLSLIKPRKATVQEVALVHKEQYISSVEQICAQGGGHLDADTVVSGRSYEVAMFAVGGLLEACDAVIRGDIMNCFCLVRPPGHHAMPDRGMGFCLFNNIAIAAKYLQKKHNIKRIAIIDWDVHHGNGTQYVFWTDPSVFYFSIHRYPFYPGTGAAEDRGGGDGEGTTLNIPFTGWEERETIVAKFEEAVRGAVTDFAPEFVLVSAGFDAYERDPIGGLGLKIEDYRRLTDVVCEMAEKTAKNRLISTIEGGYSLEGLPLMVAQHIEGLLSASSKQKTE